MAQTAKQIIPLGKDLKNVFLTEPENYSSSHEYFRMKNLVNNLQLSDFVLPSEFPKTCTEGKIHQEQCLRISIFMVPKGSKIPIHDHPNMNVICKMLKGKINYSEYVLYDQSYQIKIPILYMKSLENKEQINFPQILAEKRTKVLVAGDMGYITPEINLHSFSALEDSVFIDVICPDYDDKEIFMNLYEQIEIKENNQDILLKMNPPKISCLPQIKVEIV